MRLCKRRSKKRSYVRYLRLLNNISIGELAYKANIDPLTLNKIELGVVPCSELNARRLAEFFGQPCDWESFLTRSLEYV